MLSLRYRININERAGRHQLHVMYRIDINAILNRYRIDIAIRNMITSRDQGGCDVRSAWELVANKRRQSETPALVDEVVGLCNASSSAFEKEFGISLSKIVTKKGEKSSGVTYNKAYNVTIVLSKMNALAEILRLAS